MPVHGGKFATVDGISSVRKWSINDDITLPKAVNSASQMGTIRRRGIRSWTGSYDAFGAIPAVMPGSFFDFAGYSAPDNDTLGADGVIYSGNALVDSIVLNWNFQTGDILSHVVNFRGNLALAYGSDNAIEDLTTPDIAEMCGLKVQYDVGSGYVDWGNVTTVALTITAQNQSYVNSSTNIAGVCWTGAKSGPLDLTLAVGEQDNIRTLFDLGDDLKLKLFTDASLFWEIWFAKVKGFSGITADTETGAILARTCNLEWNAFADVQGKILKPGGAQYWGAAPTTTTP